MNSVLVDTNILVYAIDEDSKYFQAAQNLIFNSEYQLFTTSKNISEFLAVITKGLNPPLLKEKALSIIEDFEQFIRIIYPSPLSFSVFKKMINQYNPTGFKVHDIEIISIALAHQITQVATVNYKDFSNIKEIELVKV